VDRGFECKQNNQKEMDSVFPDGSLKQNTRKISIGGSGGLMSV
jgi:hypothetical protein